LGTPVLIKYFFKFFAETLKNFYLSINSQKFLKKPTKYENHSKKVHNLNKLLASSKTFNNMKVEMKNHEHKKKLVN
jgi:hypothetical protein